MGDWGTEASPEDVEEKQRREDEQKATSYAATFWNINNIEWDHSYLPPPEDRSLADSRSHLDPAFCNLDKRPDEDVTDDDKDEKGNSTTTTTTSKGLDRVGLKHWFHSSHNTEQKARMVGLLVACYPNISTVKFKAGALLEFPERLCELGSLTRLSLPHNALRSLPSEFTRLEKLQRLNLSNNCFKSIPDQLSGLNNLTKCVMHTNRLNGIVTVPRMTSLQHLDLDHNEVKELPGLENLVCLKTLKLNNNNLKVLPSQIDGLPELETLLVNQCEELNYPKSLSKLESLRVGGIKKEVEIENWSMPSLLNIQLRADDSAATGVVTFRLTPAICRLEKLRHLFVASFTLDWWRDEDDVNVKTTKEEDEVKMLPSLTSLMLERCAITSLPESIGVLTSLKLLKLESNLLFGLPSSIGKLTNLKQLFLNDNKLLNLPSEIGLLAKLKHFDARNNKLESLPEEFGNLSNTLRVLNLKRNTFSTMPSTIGKLTNLTNLNMKGNLLRSAFDTSEYSFPRLISLNLDNNAIQSLGTGISSCSELETLKLNCNALHHLPEQISQLKLRELHLSCNRLFELPHTLGALTSLTVLNLMGNNLRELPPEIGMLTDLQRLILAHNHLTTVPISLVLLQKLKLLNLHDNELPYFPCEIRLPHDVTFACEFECDEESFSEEGVQQRVGSLVHLAASEYLKDENMRSFITTQKLSPLPQELQEALRASVRLCGNDWRHDDSGKLVFGKPWRLMATSKRWERLFPLEFVFCSRACLREPETLTHW